jgi:tetratricopeptide (TPR) repeat protein
VPRHDDKSEQSPIRVYDAYGRERLINREVWRDQILPQNIRNNWHNAEVLYNLLAEALGDGYAGDIVKAAEHLHKLDKRSARSTCLYGVVLTRVGKIRDAERVMHTYLGANGEDGYVLLNLAKAYSAGNEKTKARETLWRAIEVDPNVENALQWYGAIEREESGPAALTQTWQRIARLPNSWRVRLFLARDALAGGRLQDALGFYKEALSIVGDPPSADALMSITGDLGSHGHVQEALAIGTEHFSVKDHGLSVGNNLIKANFDLNQFDAAQRIVDLLYAQERPDYKDTLDYWAAEISKARIAKKNEALDIAEPIAVAMIFVSRPLWLPDTLPVNRLFPAPVRSGPTIAILGSTASFQGESPTVALGLTTVPGMLSRAFPMFLEQELFFRTPLSAQTLIPWVTEGSQGYMLGQRPWTDAHSAEVASRKDVDAEWIVIVHLHAKSDPWTMDFRLVRTARAICEYAGSATLKLDDPVLDPQSLVSGILSAIREKTDAKELPIPSPYDVPRGKGFYPYLMSLEGLLTLKTAKRAGGIESLHSPRDIIDRVLGLAVDCPSNIAARLLLIQTARAMKEIAPTIVSEYESRLERLERECPLEQSTQGS